MFKIRLSGEVLLLILAAVSAPSYAQTTSSDPSQMNAALELSAHNSNPPTLQERYPRYQLMPSDILAVSFPLIPELQTVSVTVQPDGFITLPNGLGSMYVKGDTIPQLVDILTKAYSKTLEIISHGRGWIY